MRASSLLLLVEFVLLVSVLVCVWLLPSSRCHRHPSDLSVEEHLFSTVASHCPLQKTYDEKKDKVHVMACQAIDILDPRYGYMFVATLLLSFSVVLFLGFSLGLKFLVYDEYRYVCKPWLTGLFSVFLSLLYGIAAFYMVYEKTRWTTHDDGLLGLSGSPFVLGDFPASWESAKLGAFGLLVLKIFYTIFEKLLNKVDMHGSAPSIKFIDLSRVTYTNSNVYEGVSQNDPQQQH